MSRPLFCVAAAAAAAAPPAHSAPHGFACLTPATASRAFCDASAPLAARVADLLAALTTAEKIGLLGAAGGDTCAVIDAGAPRLGITNVTQLIEVTGAVSSACVPDGDGVVRCPTVFPAPLALAASFNRTLMRLKGAVTGVEARALNNAWATRIYGPEDYVDLLAFGPDLNVIVDPRNGRNGENPSEDPFLAGVYGVEVLRGAQEGEDARYVQLSMAVKHFAVYQMETDRFGSDANVTNFDLLDTYLPPYAAAFIDGRAMGSMCAYDAINGVPSCADRWLLTDLVRGFWGRPDAYTLSDCGAIEDQVTFHRTAANVSDASAQSIRAGCDGCAGSGFIVDGGVAGALAAGELAPADVDAALGRLLAQRFRLGMFDDPAHSAYTRFGLERVGEPAARAAAADAAAQGAVLLVNAAAVLPLALPPALRAVAVLGPHAVSKRDLLGDFYGDAFCPGVSNRSQRADSCVPTFGDAVVDALAARGRGDVAVTVAEGVAIGAPDASGAAAAEAVAAAAAADVTLLFLGYSTALVEREGADHNYTTLPPGQAAFAAAVLAAARGPVVLVLVNAGAIALDTLPRAPDALVEAWYPSFGAPAIVEQLFGGTNRWGRLPLTVYESAFASRVALADASVSGPGAKRTWRYYDGAPNHVFGDGLSYSDFSLACSTASPLAFNTSAGVALAITVECTSAITSGAPAGDAILLAFHAAGSDVRAAVGGAHPVPRGSLRGFDRVRLPGAGASEFALDARAFALVDAAGASVLYAGTHELAVVGFGGARWAVNVTLVGEPVTISRPPPLPAAGAG